MIREILKARLMAPHGCRSIPESRGRLILGRRYIAMSRRSSGSHSAICYDPYLNTKEIGSKGGSLRE
jgi:hypothetical protein